MARTPPIRFAVVGLGYFAQDAILPAFGRTKGAKCVALVSDDPRKRRELSSKYGIETAVGYDGYDDLLRSGAIDAVYIALPNDLHCDYTVRAAEAGIHVLVEKPMAATVEECERMIRACQENDVRLMVAYRLHFEPANLAAADAVRSRTIGDARCFSSVFSFPVKAGNIRTKAERAGGPLNDIGIYCINAARYIFQDEPDEVVACATQSDDPRFAEVPETVSAILTFPGDRIASFTCNYAAQSIAEYTVLGTKGHLSVEDAYEFTSGITLETCVGDKAKTRRFGKRDQVAPEILHFCDCIRTGKDPEPSGKEGLIDVRILRAIDEACATGQRIPIGAPVKSRRPTGRMAARVRPHRQPKLVDAEAPHED